MNIPELQAAFSGPHAYTQNFLEDVQAFVHAVAWREEHWLWAVGSFEALLWILVWLNRRHWERQAFIFILITAILSSAERLNRLGSQHWKAFSTQNYFDEHGAFLGVVVGIPLLLCQLLIVFFLLREASVMVIKVKRLELKQKYVQKKKEEAGAAAAAAAAAAAGTSSAAGGTGDTASFEESKKEQ
mmetsp:Transcript_42031/g.62806  ORF Transcript_42031/g.62806 Transcript_42031/m.62806 type:complete len:186 (+) Transcript_42031:2-559(+)